MKIITLGDDGYMMLGKVSVDCGYNTEELKTMWRLADTILRNQNELFICMKIIEAEFKMI